MKISIITVTYNSAETIEATIRSVLRQTYKHIEYIIIDGKSTDDTINIIRRFEPHFNGNMKWMSEADKGIYDAMNKGIRMATGNIIGILNSDDFFTSDNILEQIAANINDVDAVYGDIHFIKSSNPDKCVRYYSSKIFRPPLLRYGLMPAHPSFYVRREIYERYGLYSLDYKIAADYDMMVRLFHKHKIKTKYLSLDFVTMRTGGISTKDMSNRWLITKEDVTACRRNGLYTNTLLICMKYFIKIFELKLS